MRSVKRQPELPAALPASVRTAVAFYYLLLVAPGLCWVASKPGVQSLLQGFVIPSALLLAYYAVFGARLWLGMLLLSAFVALSPAELAFIAEYGHPSDYDIVGTLIESNSREIRDFLGWRLWPIAIAFACSTTAALSAPILAKRYNVRWKGESRIYVLAIAAVLPAMVFGITITQSDGTLPRRLANALSEISGYVDNVYPGYPFGVPHRGYAYYQAWEAMREQSVQLRDFRFGAKATPDVRSRQIYVFIIGESSRRDHWSLFGYGRNTNPELARTANLVPLPNVITPWSASRLAIPVLLTRKPASDSQLAFREPSILKVYSEAGFRTSWLSNQLAVGQHDSSVSATAYEAEHVRFLNPATWIDPGTYDEVLLPSLKEAIEGSSDNLFVVLHTMGSHGKYAYRYPPEFDRFQPSLKSAASGRYDELLLNSYDNSIVYTDHFVAATINTLKATGLVAALFYSSDHGEDIPNGVCSLSGHGTYSYSNFIVPALFWYSDQYAAVFPDKIERLRSNAGRPLTTEYFFGTMVDLAGITFPSHDQSRSLFSSGLRERHRLVNTFGQVDIDHANFGKQCQTVIPGGP